MKLGTGDRKQMVLASVLGVFALGACVYIYEEMFATDTPATVSTAVAAPVVPAPARAEGGPGGKAKSLTSSSVALDPTLHMQAMLVTEQMEYAGAGRNIFSAVSAPVQVAIPAPIAPARKEVATGPPPPPPPPPTCPPTCPPIPLKFFGTLTRGNGTREAFLLSTTDDVFPAAVGDIVMRRYRVVSIAANSIEIEDMPNGNKQRLPLLVN